MENLVKLLRPLWKWLKKNWLLVLITLVVAGLFLKGCEQVDAYDRLLGQYEEQSQDHQRQIKELRTLQDTERKERQRIVQEYIDELHRIEREYKAELDRIATQRDATQERIIREHERDPTTITQRLKETFGIPVD
jgi:allophanate hydrolase subunit 1